MTKVRQYPFTVYGNADGNRQLLYYPTCLFACAQQ